jgi:hypothetical protein
MEPMDLFIFKALCFQAGKTAIPQNIFFLWELRKQAIFTVCDWALTQGPGDQNGW